MKDFLKLSFKKHVLIFFTMTVLLIFFVLSMSRTYSDGDIENKYSTYGFRDYYGIFKDNNYEALHALKHTLETGGIALLGSSELTSNKSRFTPYKFYNENLGVPLRAFGHGGYQELAISTQLLSVMNPQTLVNGKIVILISPSWFISGLSTNENLWRKEIATPMIIARIRDNKYIDKNIKKQFLSLEVNNLLMNKLDSLLMKYLDHKFMQQKAEVYRKKVIKIKINWWDLKNEARVFEKKLSSNNYDINDEYFNLYVKPSIEKGDFPLIIKPFEPVIENPEINDFKFMLTILKKFKNPPIFVILPLSSKAYSNLKDLEPYVRYIKDSLNKEGYPLMDLWSRPYEQGVLTDIMHTGAYGWVLIDEFINRYF